jgi:hypothetical protein
LYHTTLPHITHTVQQPSNMDQLVSKMKDLSIGSCNDGEKDLIRKFVGLHISDGASIVDQIVKDENTLTLTSGNESLIVKNSDGVIIKTLKIYVNCGIEMNEGNLFDFDLNHIPSF